MNSGRGSIDQWVLVLIREYVLAWNHPHPLPPFILLYEPSLPLCSSSQCSQWPVWFGIHNHIIVPANKTKEPLQTSELPNYILNLLSQAVLWIKRIYDFYPACRIPFLRVLINRVTSTLLRWIRKIKGWLEERKRYYFQCG